METLLEISGLALATAVSFTLAWLGGWLALAGVVRLLPASAPGEQAAAPAPLALRTSQVARANRRPRVVVAPTKNRSRKMYTVRVA